jgi:hypothetical protein
VEKSVRAGQAADYKMLWCFACCITKARIQTHTCLEYALLTAFSHQQWLHKHASVLCYDALPVLFSPKYGLSET